MPPALARGSKRLVKKDSRMRITVSVLAAMTLLALAPAVRAASSNDLGHDETEAVRPWAKGVSAADQRTALQLFQKGNGDLKNSFFLDAANAYRDALKHWDHPAIHYNLVLALLNLDQPVEVHEHLVAAMKYGAAPLDEDKLAQAKRYKSLVEKQLTHLTLTCSEPGAKVVLDGKPLFTAPGNFDGWVRSGPHTIVATKEGFESNQVSKSLPGGKALAMDLKLYTAADLTEYRRKWKGWVPWAVVGAGIVVGAAGGGMHYLAHQDFASFDNAIKGCASADPAVGGCIPDASAASKRSQGNTLQAAAIGAYAVGGAALVTGAILVYVNRLQPYRIDPNDKHVDVSVAPMIGPGQAGVWAQARF